MSESLHAGFLPLWNPYINFGIPQYADMNSGYWSPITWIIAGSVGYNAYTVTIETLFYILLGGLGFYKLCSHWIDSKNVSIIAGLAFMCCGYHVAHLQHFNWLSGSAFLPWCMWSYIKFLKGRTWLSTLSTVLLFYLFVASAHPGLIIGSFYFFAAIMLFCFFQNGREVGHTIRLKRYAVDHTIFISALLLLSFGIIAGYSDIVPHFVRGEKIPLSASIVHSSNIRTYLSFLLPFSTVKNEAFFNTELTLRNSYFSLTMLVFFLTAIIRRKNPWQKFLLGLGLVFGLLSSGGIITEIAHEYLPFIGYVRLVGEFRIFAIIPFILVAALELDKFTTQSKVEAFQKLKLISWAIASILCALLTWAVFIVVTKGNSFLLNISNLQSPTGFADLAKQIVDSITFYDTIWIQSSIQLILLSQLYRALKSRNLNYIKWIIIIDVILTSMLNIPFTGVGKTSVSHLQSVLDKSPKGIPIPELKPISNNDTLSKNDDDLIGSWSMYNKQPGTLKEMPYPIQLRNMRSFFDNSQQTEINYFEKPFLYTDNGKAALTILNFSPNKIVLKAKVDTTSRLILLQNYYLHWRYRTNGESQSMLKEGINFMAVPLNKGNNEITLFFDPKHIKVAMCVSAMIFIVYVLLFLFFKVKQKQI